MGVFTRMRAAGTVTVLAAAVGAQVLVGQPAAQAAPGCHPHGLIGDHWNSTGGNGSALGPCTTDEFGFFGVQWEMFANGIVLWSPLIGVVPIVWGGPAPTPGGGFGSQGAAALSAAQSRIGSPYQYGATGPGSFDCSGLVQWSFAQSGVQVPRTTFDQVNFGTPINRGDLRPGDVVFFYGNGHDGIYAGNNRVIHAPQAGQSVTYENMDYMPYSTARRY